MRLSKRDSKVCYLLNPRGFLRKFFDVNRLKNMGIATKYSSNEFWNKSAFWGHLFILFAIFVYLYSPLINYASGQHIHSRPHTHIPVSFNPFQHSIDDGHFHAESESDEYICALEFDGLILLSLFVTLNESTDHIIPNVFVYQLETNSINLISDGQPPPNPPPRSFSLTI